MVKKRFYKRWLLLLVVVFMQGCCWSDCPQPWKSAVEWHTGHGDSDE
jgi:hypothetical protein